MAALKVVVGNTAPQYQITCERPDGTVIDLTNCTVTLTLYRSKIQTNTGHESSSVSIVNAAGGVIGWQPKTGDFDAKGTFKANIKVTYSDASVEILFNQAQFKARDIVR